MTLPAPRVVIVDDNPAHVKALSDNLLARGIGCIPIHFTGETESIRPCPNIRVLFADLHLLAAGAGTTNAQHFGVIVSLLEESFVPKGPYAIVLWTQHAEEADALRAFLHERLTTVPKPYIVVPLDKLQHLNADDKVLNDGALADAISTLLSAPPQIAALFDWEDRVLGAAADTVSSVVDLALRSGPAGSPQAIGKILYRLAFEAVGEGNIAADRFKAVNEALLPILADKIAALRSDEAAVARWTAALDGQSDADGLMLKDAADLNRLVNIADAGMSSDTDRGSVAVMSPAMLEAFEGTFGVTQAVAGVEEFALKDYTVGGANMRWLLVQLQPICDFAQSQAGPLPYALALEMPFAKVPKDKPGSMIQTPPFDVAGQVMVLRINTRFMTMLVKPAASALTVAYRLREGLVNEIQHHLHTQGNRPGMIQFRHRPGPAQAAGAPQTPQRPPKAAQAGADAAVALPAAVTGGGPAPAEPASAPDPVLVDPPARGGG